MFGVAVEDLLELWSSELRGTKGRHGGMAAGFLDGPLGPERRKTGWMPAFADAAKGYSTPKELGENLIHFHSHCAA